MKIRLSPKNILILIVFFVLEYHIYKGSENFFSILRTILVIALVPWFFLISRNLNFSGWFFKNRFYWFYPFIFIITFALMAILGMILERKIIHGSSILIIFSVAIFMGLIWGLIEKYKTKKYSSEGIIERVEVLHEQPDDDISGFLIWNNNHLSFLQKSELLFKLSKAEIKQISVNSEYIILPTHLEIEHTDGTKYMIDSQFPFVWKNLLLQK